MMCESTAFGVTSANSFLTSKDSLVKGSHEAVKAAAIGLGKPWNRQGKGAGASTLWNPGVSFPSAGVLELQDAGHCPNSVALFHFFPFVLDTHC